MNLNIVKPNLPLSSALYNTFKLYMTITAWKVSKYGVISGPNTGKYGPEITPYLDTFHAVHGMTEVVVPRCSVKKLF